MVDLIDFQIEVFIDNSIHHFVETLTNILRDLEILELPCVIAAEALWVPSLSIAAVTAPSLRPFHHVTMPLVVAFLETVHADNA